MLVVWTNAHGVCNNLGGRLVSGGGFDTLLRFGSFPDFPLFALETLTLLLTLSRPFLNGDGDEAAAGTAETGDGDPVCVCAAANAFNCF